MRTIKRSDGYEGPDERKPEKNQTVIFGMSIESWIKVLLTVGGILVFAVKADQRLTVIEGNQKAFLQVAETLQTYVGNADNYHSALTGVPFRMGRPETQNGFELAKIRDAISFKTQQQANH